MKKLAILVILNATIGVILARGEAKTAVAVEATKAPIIDGKIQEGEWPYWQNSFSACPGDAVARQQTKFAVMFDKNNIYIAVKCDEIHIDKVKIYRKNNINIWRYDGLEIFIQKPNNNNGYVQFLVSAGNGRYGLRFPTATSAFKQVIPYAKWLARAKFNKRGYTVELKIPLSLFAGAKPQKGTEWRFNIQRNSTTPDSDRYSSWSPVSQFHNPMDFGYLIFALADPQRITLKRKFNQLKFQIDGFHHRYKKYDPVFASKIEAQLKQLNWVKFKQQAAQIMQLDTTLMIKFPEKLKTFSNCLEQLKQEREENLLKKICIH